MVEHGVVTGEIVGLEIARIELSDDGDARLEVGVGRHDREAFAMIHGDLPTAAALAAVVDEVRSHRRAGAAATARPRVPVRRVARPLAAGERPAAQER